MVFTYYYVLGVPYSCGVVLVFLVLAFLVLRTYLIYNTVVGLCHFFCCGGKVRYYDRKKKNSSRLSGGCAIVITTGKIKF